jgi:GntR family transcriptional repressor for pyruvate dehydrogenase complex
MRRLSEISHNALLSSLCRFLVDVQVDLAFTFSGGRVSEWRRVVGGLHTERLAIVEALESRSAERTAEAVETHTARAITLIMSTSQAKKIEIADPGYSHLLAALLNTKRSSAAH